MPPSLGPEAFAHGAEFLAACGPLQIDLQLLKLNSQTTCLLNAALRVRKGQSGRWSDLWFQSQYVVGSNLESAVQSWANLLMRHY